MANMTFSSGYWHHQPASMTPTYSHHHGRLEMKLSMALQDFAQEINQDLQVSGCIFVRSVRTHQQIACCFLDDRIFAIQCPPALTTRVSPASSATTPCTTTAGNDHNICYSQLPSIPVHGNNQNESIGFNSINNHTSNIPAVISQARNLMATSNTDIINSGSINKAQMIVSSLNDNSRQVNNNYDQILNQIALDDIKKETSFFDNPVSIDNQHRSHHNNQLALNHAVHDVESIAGELESTASHHHARRRQSVLSASINQLAKSADYIDLLVQQGGKDESVRSDDQSAPPIELDGCAQQQQQQQQQQQPNTSDINNYFAICSDYFFKRKLSRRKAKRLRSVDPNRLSLKRDSSDCTAGWQGPYNGPLPEFVQPMEPIDLDNLYDSFRILVANSLSRLRANNASYGSDPLVASSSSSLHINDTHIGECNDTTTSEDHQSIDNPLADPKQFIRLMTRRVLFNDSILRLSTTSGGNEFPPLNPDRMSCLQRLFAELTTSSDGNNVHQMGSCTTSENILNDGTTGGGCFGVNGDCSDKVLSSQQHQQSDWQDAKKSIRQYCKYLRLRTPLTSQERAFCKQLWLRGQSIV